MVLFRIRRLLQNCKIYRYDHGYKDKLPKHLSSPTIYSIYECKKKKKKNMQKIYKCCYGYIWYVFYIEE